MARRYRALDTVTGEEQWLAGAALLTLPSEAFILSDNAGNHTLAIEVSGNLTGNRSVSYVDPGGNVAIDLSNFAGETWTPGADTVGSATNGNISTANTTLSDMLDSNGNKVCFLAEASERYSFAFYFPWKGPNTTDGFKLAVTGPASPNVVWYAFQTPVTTGTINASIAATAFGTTLTQAGGVNMSGGWPIASVNGFLDNGNTSGNVTLQVVSEVGGNTTFYAGAHVVAHKLP